MKIFKRILFPLFILLITIVLSGCSSQKNRKFEKSILQELSLVGFRDHFTGLMIYNPATSDTLLAVNQNQYFTPASNTKIFTLYTALKILGDSLPALKYSSRGDTLFFGGTGYPATMHPYFRDSSAVKFMDSFGHLTYVLSKFSEGRFGPGWAWEDYDSSFSAERSAFPLYGNVIAIYNSKEGLHAEPEYFRDSIVLADHGKKRMEDRNRFFYEGSGKDTLEIPFITSDRQTAKLLESALGKTVLVKDHFPEGELKLLYGTTTADSLYKRLMQESDNFIAEQLLIVSSAELSDTLSISKARDFLLENHLMDMKYKPRWVDGSGLSRYNLFTPSSMVFVLEKLLREKSSDWLFEIFPAGGKNGTLSDWYPGLDRPYIFAKSGTLGNTYCLSGYLITKSGKLLIFSFMNNHFMQPTSEVKTGIQRILETVRDSY